jgi:hypothetical protein
VLDAFSRGRLGLKAMKETRHRVQYEQLGHRGRKHDPLYRIRNAHAPAPTSSVPARSSESRPGSKPATQPGKSPSPGTATSSCGQRSRPPTSPRAAPSPPRCSSRFPPARSPKSAGPYTPGRSSSWPTSPPAAPATAPKRSTASSNPPPHRPRLPQPTSLPATDDLGRRTTHPPKSLMSHLSPGRREAMWRIPSNCFFVGR